jgi:hypothetical protein
MIEINHNITIALHVPELRKVYKLTEPYGSNTFIMAPEWPLNERSYNTVYVGTGVSSTSITLSGNVHSLRKLCVYADTCINDGPLPLLTQHDLLNKLKAWCSRINLRMVIR